jgi:GDSL-like Lipase/Acylhydrolase family
MRLTLPRRTPPSRHLVLLGDSVFDNSSYVDEGLDVTTHFRSLLPEGWNVTLAARDGATTHSLGWQFRNVPEDATHLVVSVGGNNALGNSDLLTMSRKRLPNWAKGLPGFQAALVMLHDRVDAFAGHYAEAMDEVRELGLPTTVCTIYNPDYSEPRASAVRTALSAFNDVIIRYARRNDLPLIELRDIVYDPEDFSNSIEPSAFGGWRIAHAITQHVTTVPPGKISPDWEIPSMEPAAWVVAKVPASN